ncbi:hypothetical protein D3C81_1106890 [compost metagenome]
MGEHLNRVDLAQLRQGIADGSDGILARVHYQRSGAGRQVGSQLVAVFHAGIDDYQVAWRGCCSSGLRFAGGRRRVAGVLALGSAGIAVVLLIDSGGCSAIEENALLKGNGVRPRARGSGKAGSALDVHFHPCSEV